MQWRTSEANSARVLSPTLRVQSFFFGTMAIAQFFSVRKSPEHSGNERMRSLRLEMLD